MRVSNRCRHQNVCFVRCIPEHETLIASALVFRLAPVDALSDIRRLLADRVEHGTGVAIESHRGIRVANPDDRAAHHFLEVDVGRSRDLAGDQHHAGLDQRFAGNARTRVVLENGIEDRIGNLVRNFVRVTLGH